MFRTFYLFFMMLMLAFNAVAAEVVIKSTTNRNEINVGDYWIGEDLAEGFQKIGKTVDIDYRDEYNRLHTPEPKFNIFMRGYTKFIAPFPKGINVLYCYYPMAFWKTSGNKQTKKELAKRAQMPPDSSLDDDWQNYEIITVASPSVST